MKQILLAAAVLGVCSAPACADPLPGELSAHVGAVSDYVFRGVSRNDGDPTLQGGVDWQHPATGVYAGAWASGADLDDAWSEVDLYAGLNGVKQAMTWDVGLIYTIFPGGDDSLDYWEIAGALGYDFDLIQISASLNYSPDYIFNSDSALYSAIHGTVPLPFDLSVSGGAGYQWISDNDRAGLDSYADWSLGLHYEWDKFDFGVKYTDTNLDDSNDCDGCDDNVVFSVKRNF